MHESRGEAGKKKKKKKKKKKQRGIEWNRAGSQQHCANEQPQQWLTPLRGNSPQGRMSSGGKQNKEKLQKRNPIANCKNSKDGKQTN